MSLKNDWWKILIGVSMSVMIYGAFMYAPPAKGLGESTRVLYFHVPCAWIGSLAFLVSAIYSILYLRRQKVTDDIYAASSAQIGFVFTILATVTGSIWAKEIWHSYWNWDPRQTSIFFLLMIYAAYLVLRSAIEEFDKRARLAAVYSIIAFVTVPFFTYIAPRIYESLHPDPIINADAKINMESRMQHVLWGSTFIFIGLYYWLLKIKSKIALIDYTVENHELQEEG